jgi:hypothetical protein
MNALRPVCAAAIVLLFCGTRFGPAVAQNSPPWKRHVIDASSLGADGVRAADVNADGVPDLVTSWEQGGVTRAYLADRDGSGHRTWRTVTVGQSPDAEDALFFDADGDGALDVISSTEGRSRRILVHWAPPLAKYTQPREWKTATLYADGSQWMFAAPIDVDRRAGLDLIVGGKNERASVGWLEAPPNPRQPGSWKYHRLSDAGWIMSLIVTDMNGDGLQDVLLSDRFGPLAGVRWLENPGPASRTIESRWTTHWIGARDRSVMLIDYADLDGDGINEVVVPYYVKNDFHLSLFKRGGRGNDETWIEHEIRYPSLAGRPKSAAIGDIDGDRKPDLVLSCEQAYAGKRGIVWLRFRESPFTPEWDAFDVSGPEGVKFDLNLLLDVDMDGDLDVINSEENDNAKDGKAGLGVVWYENPTRF